MTDSPDRQNVQAAPLPLLRDGVVVCGPGTFTHYGDLEVEGHVTLRDLILYLTGPTHVRTDARLTLERVRLVIADPPTMPNGTSSLTCEGAAELIMHDSSIEPVGAAHPMWWWQGRVEMRRVRTHNAELHLRQVTALIEDTSYFELEISQHSVVQARRVAAIFLSTHTAHEERLTFTGIPAQRRFSLRLSLGSGASVDWDDSSLEMLLIFVYGHTHAHLERVERAQIAVMLDNGSGRYHLPRGHLGTSDAPHHIPAPLEGDADGPSVTLVDVGVDSWDAYVSGGPEAHYVFVDSVIDELTLRGQVRAEVERSHLYADWLAMRDDAALRVRDSTVGALSLAGERPDLLTSQVKLAGTARAHFQRVRFDCGILARDSSQVTLEDIAAPPTYMMCFDQARIIEGPIPPLSAPRRCRP